MTDITDIEKQISRLESHIAEDLRNVALATRSATGSILVRMKALEGKLDDAGKRVDRLNESLDAMNRSMP